MNHPATWRTRVLGGAAVAALLCTFVFGENTSAASSASKSTKKASAQKSQTTTQHSTATARKASPSGKSKKSSTRTVSRKGKHSKQNSRRGQQKIDNPRTLEIQQALIKQHYMSGEPSGKWDASTEAALRKYQGDNGWQNKTVPDSRALIKLGLGPSHDHLLNPESAMTTSPEVRNSGATKPARGPSESTPASNQPN